ncbi:MAG: msbA [Paenibacillaceae bacterium]|jgi:subfamily B ATP-binding cassette protein MsbA|nr:msbA [Paenibacillaceae bacterium]
MMQLGEMKRPVGLLWRFIKPSKWLYLQLVVYMLGGIGMTIIFTWFLQQLTDAALSGNVAKITELLLQGILVVIINGLLTFLSSYIGTAAVQQVKMDMKNTIFAHMVRLEARYYNRYHSGEFVSRLTNDINNLDGAIGGNLVQMIRLPLMALASLLYMLTINWRLSVICLLLVPVAAVTGAIFGKLLRRNTRLIQEYLSRIQGFLHETFSASPIIRSFTLAGLMTRQYEKQNAHLMGLEMKQARIRGMFQVGSGTVGSATFFLSMGLGAYFVAEQTMSVGNLVAFNNLMHQMVAPLSGLAGLWGGFQRSLSSAERIVHVLEEKAEPVSPEEQLELHTAEAPGGAAAGGQAEVGGNDPAGAVGAGLPPVAGPMDGSDPGAGLPVAAGGQSNSGEGQERSMASSGSPPPEIMLREISFAYEDGAPVLEQLSLTVPAGKVVALVGHSGAGKSTLLSLLQGFYKPDRGELLLDGVPMGRIPLGRLRRSIAYVPQETILFSGTILENIAYGRLGATREEIMQAAGDANALDFISRLPEGFETQVGERGARLSGGQRQRIAIARAILKDAPVLLLDEATSALDTETEHLVQEALARLMRRRTTIVIAHRLSTIQNADLIAVLDQGKVVETGTHWELLRRKGNYFRLYQMQFKDQPSPSADAGKRQITGV